MLQNYNGERRIVKETKMKMSEYMAESIKQFSKLLENEDKIRSINLGKVFLIELIDCYSQILNKNKNIIVGGYIHTIIDCYIRDIYDIKALDRVVDVLTKYEKMEINEFLNKEVKYSI